MTRASESGAGDAAAAVTGTAGVEDAADPAAARVSRPIPEATVARLAVYLRMLGEFAEQGAETVSSEELATASGVNSAKLRKDLSYLGSYGIRGVGYEVRALLQQLERVLGLDHRQSVALVGVGNLGHALAGYAGFGGRGFPVDALFDVDPDLVGIQINGIVVEHVRDIATVCRARGVTIGMVATPGPGRPGRLRPAGRGGVESILNFAPVVLQVPRRGRGAQGGPGGRAADPRVPRRASPRCGSGTGWNERIGERIGGVRTVSERQRASRRRSACAQRRPSLSEAVR